MSLSTFVSFKSRFVTYLLNFLRKNWRKLYVCVAYGANRSLSSSAVFRDSAVSSVRRWRCTVVDSGRFALRTSYLTRSFRSYNKQSSCTRKLSLFVLKPIHSTQTQKYVGFSFSDFTDFKGLTELRRSTTEMQ